MVEHPEITLHAGRGFGLPHHLLNNISLYFRCYFWADSVSRDLEARCQG